jgi:hypothetical protein
MVVGMPSGQSFDLSRGSLWRHKRQMLVKYHLIGGGRLFWYIFWKMKLRFLDVDGNWAWMRLINISIESAFALAPLLRLAWRMVVQMLPGRA